MQSQYSQSSRAWVWWASKGGRSDASICPRERFHIALSIRGLRPRLVIIPHLKATLIRSAGFFSSRPVAYWALLPLVARRQITGGAALYGVMLGAIGAGRSMRCFRAATSEKNFLGRNRLFFRGRYNGYGCRVDPVRFCTRAAGCGWRRAYSPGIFVDFGIGLL